MRRAADLPEVRAAIARARAWVAARVADQQLPGLSIAVVDDQEPIWVEAFGAVRPGTVFRIGSITKAFTATALLRLRDEGRLGLDDPIARHLPWLTSAGDGPPPTIRQILTHRTGLQREAPFPYWSDFAFPSAAALRQAVATLAPVHPPEVRWKYSNLAYALAGLVIEAVTGRSYADHLQEAVLVPLGLNAEIAPAETMPQLARGHGRRIAGAARTVRPHSDLGALAAAGGIATTAADLARFVMLQFRDPAPGSDVLSGATLREMRRVQRLDEDWQAGWGLGFRLWRDAGRTWAGHGGLIAGFASDMRFEAAANLGVVVLANAEDAVPGLIAQRIAQWFLPALTDPASPAPPADPHAARYVGRYRDAWMDMEVLQDRDGLYAMAPNWIDPAPSLVRLEPAGPHAFRMRTADGFGYADEVATFEVGADGSVVALRIGGNPLKRIATW